SLRLEVTCLLARYFGFIPHIQRVVRDLEVQFPQLLTVTVYGAFAQILPLLSRPAHSKKEQRPLK
ncbi:hypothetical protein, partial [Deinococcus sp. Arct2-2]|uniref:hypothetical protein n=1 Tax=Deinococcus sp. Arct2-2 TaxID=2568653 RepID=UPI00197B02EB